MRAPLEWLWCDVEQAPVTLDQAGRCWTCGLPDHLTLVQAQEEERRERSKLVCWCLESAQLLVSVDPVLSDAPVTVNGEPYAPRCADHLGLWGSGVELGDVQLVACPADRYWWGATLEGTTS